ncbi:cell division protein CrgA [Klugiella xanthotipulae]|nr:cell division protein CrgA [Klugiella xanthotipulae]
MAASKEVSKKKSGIDKRRAPQTTRPDEQAPNPVWFKPVMFGFMLLGLIWIIVYYVGGSLQLPVPALQQGNIFVGFGIMFIGFLMTTRWR